MPSFFLISCLHSLSILVFLVNIGIRIMSFRTSVSQTEFYQEKKIHTPCLRKYTHHLRLKSMSLCSKSFSLHLLQMGPLMFISSQHFVPFTQELSILYTNMLIFDYILLPFIAQIMSYPTSLYKTKYLIDKICHKFLLN